MLGRASQYLLHELQRFVTSHRLVFWFDRHREYTRLVEALSDEDPETLGLSLHPYRDSFLELMLSLEQADGRHGSTGTVVYLPGFLVEDVRQTPLLELYNLGRRFQRKLPTVVGEAARGLADAETVADFTGQPGLTLEAAERWLATLATQPDGDLQNTLDSLELRGVVTALLRSDSLLAERCRVEGTGDAERVWQWLNRTLAMPKTWREVLEPEFLGRPGTPASPGDLADAAIRFCMALEYVHDRHTPPTQANLQTLQAVGTPVVRLARDLTTALRDGGAMLSRRYRDLALELEASLTEEIAAARPADLGSVDTFRFEHARFLDATLDGLQALLPSPQDPGDTPVPASLDTLETWTTTRLHNACFWTRGLHGAAARQAWRLAHHVVMLVSALEQAGPSLVDRVDLEVDLQPSVMRYVAVGARVDRAHRTLEQAMAQLDVNLPRFSRLKAIHEAARNAYRTWADQWAEDMARLTEKVGPLPESALQQRTLFVDEVLPRVRRADHPVAYVLADALRFEMAQELMEQLGSSADTHLTPRLAELPSNTSVGMNALAPVADDRGHLTPVMRDGDLKGFQHGAYQVTGRAHRVRAMADRLGVPKPPVLGLSDVLDAKPDALRRRLAGLPFVFMDADAIDTAGESDQLLRSAPELLYDLHQGLKRLRAAGVTEFVVTADHGFLLLDPTGQALQRNGRRSESYRRHAWHGASSAFDGQLSVSPRALRYDGLDEHVVFPRTLVRFDAPAKARSFVHGGPSLPERVIPVLHLRYPNRGGRVTTRYALDAATLGLEDGLHAVRVTLSHRGQVGLAYATAGALPVSIRAEDDDEVRVRVVDASPEVPVRGRTVELPVGEAVTLYLELTAPSDRRARLVLSHPGQEDVTPHRLTERLDVAGTQPVPPETTQADDAEASEPQAPEEPADREGLSPMPPEQPAEAWLEEIATPYRAVFAHIATHGEIHESAVLHLVGSARKVRSFSRKFDALARRAPFRIEVRVDGGLRRWTRTGGK